MPQTNLARAMLRASERRGYDYAAEPPDFTPPDSTPTPTVGSERVSPPRMGKWDAMITLGLILGGWAMVGVVAKVVRMIVRF